MIKHALTKANCFEWVHFGEYVDVKRKGCPPTVQATTKTKNVKKKEEETSKGEEELDEDVNEDIIEEPLKKRA
jgi:hypothetical protein